MGVYKGSLPGYDVFTAARESLSFDDLASPKVQLGQTPEHAGFIEYTLASLPPVGTTELFSIQHNYKYIPAVIMYYSTSLVPGAAEAFMPHVYSEVDPNPPFDFAFIQVRYNMLADRIAVELHRTGALVPTGAVFAGSTWKFRYYIFAETGI